MAQDGTGIIGSPKRGTLAAEVELLFSQNGELALFNSDFYTRFANHVPEGFVVKPDFREHIVEITPQGYWDDIHSAIRGVESLYVVAADLMEKEKCQILPTAWHLDDKMVLEVPYSHPDYRALTLTNPGVIYSANGAGYQTHYGITELSDAICAGICKLNGLVPLITALFANSFCPHTGWHSARTFHWKKLDGICFFQWDSLEKYNTIMQRYLDDRVIPKFTRLWPWIRPSIYTIEFRISDALYLPSEARAQLALNTALSELFFFEGVGDKLQALDPITLDLSLGRCAGYGLSQLDVECWTSFESGKPITMSRGFDLLFELVERKMKSMGCEQEFNTLVSMASNQDNGAMRAQTWGDRIAGHANERFLQEIAEINQQQKQKKVA